MGNIIVQSQPYPLSVTFNVFHQMTISPKVSVIQSQSKSLYIGFRPQEINAGSGLKSRSQICVGGGSHLNLANWTLDKKYQRGACLSTWQ